MKLRYKIIILVETVLIISFIISIIIFIISSINSYCLDKHKEYELEHTYIFRETSPDEQYRISANYNGKNSHGEYCILLTILKENEPQKSEDDRISYMEFVVDTGDDTFPSKENFKCEWYEDYVTITFTDNQGEIGASFRLYWDELNFHSLSLGDWSDFLLPEYFK